MPGARTRRSSCAPLLERGGLGQREDAPGAEELGGHVVALRVERLPDVDRAGDPLLPRVAEEPQLGVEEAAQPLGIAQGEAAAHGADVVGGEPPARVRGLPFDREPAPGQRPGHSLELGRPLGEAQAAPHPLDAVREAADAQPGPLEVESAQDAGRGAGPGDVHREPRGAHAPQPPRHEGQGTQVRLPASGQGERPLAQHVDPAGHREVRPLPGQVEVAELEPAAGEREPHGLPGPEGKLGQEDLEVGDDGLRPDLGRGLQGAMEEHLTGGHEGERRGKGRLERAEEGVEARRFRGEGELCRVGRRGAHAAGQGQVHAGGAAAPVDRDPAVAGPHQARLESADALVAEEEAGRGEARAQAGPRQRALHLEAAGEPAAEGRARHGRGRERPEVDAVHLARAVVDAVVGHAATEGDGAAAEAHVAPRHLGEASLPARLDARTVVGHRVVAAAERRALRLALRDAAPAADLRFSGHETGGDHVPVHERDEVRDRPRGGAGAALDRVPEAEPADLGPPFPTDLARVLAEHERPRHDRLRRRVESARPLGATPVDTAVADALALEATLEDRPVHRATPEAAEGAGAGEARGLGLWVAERPADPGEHDLGRLDVLGGALDLEAGAILRVDLAADAAAHPRPTQLCSLVGLAPVLGAPVEAPGEGEASVRSLGEVHPDPPAHEPRLSPGPAHVHLAGGGGSEAHLAPAEDHAEEALAVGLAHGAADVDGAVRGGRRHVDGEPRPAPEGVRVEIAHHQPGRAVVREPAREAGDGDAHDRRRPCPPSGPRSAAGSRRSRGSRPSARPLRSRGPCGTRASRERRCPPAPRARAAPAAAPRDGCDRGRRGSSSRRPAAPPGRPRRPGGRPRRSRSRPAARGRSPPSAAPGRRTRDRRRRPRDDPRASPGSRAGRGRAGRARG